MQQIRTLWDALSPRRRVIVLAATLAVFAAVLGLARMAAAPSMALLYAGLESGPAGEVVRALDQRGVAHEVRGGSIFVDRSQRDTLRMTLASEGLPANSSKGYELLDGLSGFGTTSQMFDAAYWRAKEGELARTVVANPRISAARVHLANAGSNPFRRDIRPTASVMITTGAGALSADDAKALRFLVASAVAGLTPKEVSIIDSAGGLIGASEDAPVRAGQERAEEIRRRVTRLLEARVGPGNAVVEVSVETVKNTESIREVTIDPESRVAISVDSEERSDQASDTGGDVTVASNLPDGDAAGDGKSSSRRSETRERINYEVSQTEREITRAPGSIRRMTVAVLVNGSADPSAGDTEKFVPRPAEELEALRELVASAVGFDEARGDVITLKTMRFKAAAPAGTAAETSALAGLGIDMMRIVQIAVLSLVALVLGLFVVRPVLTRPAPAQLAAPDTQTDSAAGPEDAAARNMALTGEIDEGEIDADGMPVISGATRAGNASDPDGRAVAEDPAARLRGLIGERQEETVEILRSWLENEEEPA